MKRYNWILCPLRYRVSSFEGIRYRAGWFITEIDIPRIAHRSLSAPSIWNFSSQDYNPFLNLRQRENGIALSRKFLISRPEYKNPGRWPFGQFFSPLISSRIFKKQKRIYPPLSSLDFYYFVSRIRKKQSIVLRIINVFKLGNFSWKVRCHSVGGFDLCIKKPEDDVGLFCIH